MARKSKSGASMSDDSAESPADTGGRGDPRGSGRLSSGDQGFSPQVTFRLTEDLRERALRRAEAEGKSVSELAREALERYLEP